MPFHEPNLVGRVTPCAPSLLFRLTEEIMAIIERRKAFWTAALLRRFFADQPLDLIRNRAYEFSGVWRRLAG
jgi:hypothetical protein